MDERVVRFAALFRGSPRGHGTYSVHGQPKPGEKIEGPRRFVHDPPSLELFERHLLGTYGLGAVPLLLDPPGHTLWAAIDVDDYSLDVPAFARRVAVLDIPVICCRTKSGGIHAYLFLLKPEPANAVRARMRSWAKVLGYPDVEVFPKQDRLADAEGATTRPGSWS